MSEFFFDPVEWLNLAARWIHVFAGIMWVGQTYFFTWLDGRLSELMEAGRQQSSPHVWMVHSGGFYVVEKQKNPRLLPATLHWFKWEAATTWLSGIFLLIVVYYLGGLMVGGTVEEPRAMAIGIAVILLAWPVYDLVWRSHLGRNEWPGTIVCGLLLVGCIFLLTHTMEGRPAYMHIGALLGTIMTANVWFRIIPAQKAMVRALEEKKEPDLTLGEAAKKRSKHNTFLAVPVVFIMISNHYPVATYGGASNWIVLIAMILVGGIAAKFIRRA